MWAISRVRDGIEVYMAGHVGAAELLLANAALYQAASEPAPAFVIFDLSNVEHLDAGQHVMRELAWADRHAAKQLPDLRTVVIAPTAHAFGVARQWEMMLDSPLARVVRSREEAERWLAETHPRGKAPTTAESSMEFGAERPMNCATLDDPHRFTIDERTFTCWPCPAQASNAEPTGEQPDEPPDVWVLADPSGDAWLTDVPVSLHLPNQVTEDMLASWWRDRQARATRNSAG